MFQLLKWLYEILRETGGLRGNELLWAKLSTAEAAMQRLSKQAEGSRGPKPLI